MLLNAVHLAGAARSLGDGQALLSLTCIYTDLEQERLGKQKHNLLATRTLGYMYKSVMDCVLQPPRRASLFDSVRKEAVPAQTSPAKNVDLCRKSNREFLFQWFRKSLFSSPLVLQLLNDYTVQ